VKVDGVLNDVALGFEVGKDIHRCVGDEQRLGIGRHIHDEDMADAPAGTQAGLLVRACGEQFVAVQAALHQKRGFPRAHEFHRLGCGRGAVGRVDDLEARHVQFGLLGHGGDPGSWTDEDRPDQALPCRFDRASKRRVVTRIRNGGGDGCELARLRDQALVMPVKRDCVHRVAPDNDDQSLRKRFTGPCSLRVTSRRTLPFRGT
jgi:hypothetical protein